MPIQQSVPGQSSDSDEEDFNENASMKSHYMMQLRKREVLAYHYICGVFRAQGHLTPEKLRLLREIAGALYIPEDRHRAECMVAVNDSVLSAIADSVAGPNTEEEWIKEGTDLRPPSPLGPGPNNIILKGCDKVANAVRDAFKNRKPGEETVKAYVYLRPNWYEEGSSSEEEEVIPDEKPDDISKEMESENKDDDLSSLSEEQSEDSAEEDQKKEVAKKEVKDKKLMPPPVEVTTPSTESHVTAAPPTSTPVDTVPLPVPVITVPPPTSITVIPPTSSHTESIQTSSVQNPQSVPESNTGPEVTLIDSEIQETPILSESDDIQFLSLPDSLDSTLPPLVVVPPAEPVITVPHSSSLTPPGPTSNTLVLPSGMSFQMREANGDIKKRKRTLSQDSGPNFSPSPKTMAFSNVSKMTPVMVSAGSSSQGQVKVTPIISRSKMAAPTNTTQKVIIVSNASSSNGSGLQRAMSVSVGPMIRAGPPHKQPVPGVLQTTIAGASGVGTKFRAKMVSVPARCRAKTNPLVIPNLQLKNNIINQDNVTVVDTNLKRLPVTSGQTRILPKPQGSGQMLIVNSSQGPKVATSVGGQSRMVTPRLVEGASPATLKPVGGKQNVVILQKGGGQRAVTLTNTSKELMQKLISKKCFVIQSSSFVPKNITPKPPPPVTTTANNVVVLDLSQEQYRHNLNNTTIADILQASGIITSTAAQTIVTSASPHISQSSTGSPTTAAEQNWVTVDRTVTLEDVTLPISQSPSVVTLDEAVEMMEDQSGSSTEVSHLIPEDSSIPQSLQIGDQDSPDQIFTITHEELAASEMGFMNEKSVVITEPLTGQIVDTISAETNVSHPFLPLRDGAVAIQHSNIDMPTNMSLEEYSSQQIENQGLN